MNNYELELISIIEEICDNSTTDKKETPIRYCKDEKTVNAFISILQNLKMQVENEVSESFTTKELALKIYDVLINAFKKGTI